MIIGLAISAIATVAFLNQGGNLSQKNKILMAQNEIARAVEQWNILKRTKSLSDMGNTDIPIITNVFGQDVRFYILNLAGGKQAVFTYGTNSNNTCTRLSSKLSSNMEGISSLGAGVSPTNPTCGGSLLYIRLD